MNLQQLQLEVAQWSFEQFGGKHGSGYRPLLGAVEELGELAHAHLKQEQGIRTNEDHQANKIDAVADTIIYLADYCSQQGIDLGQAVRVTWSEVRQRDWKADKEKGEPK